MNFIGEECIVCKKKFLEDDDIVVCEVCGTPYHRECYRQVGKCINDEYHSNGWTFTQKHGKPKQSIQEDTVTEDIPKVKENKQSPNDKLEDNYNQMISVSKDILHQVNLDPNEECLGVTLLEFYLYTKSLFNTRKFHKVANNNTSNTFNVIAFLFPEYYMAGKNMYVPAVFTFLVNFVLAIPLLMWFYPQSMQDQMLPIVSSTAFQIIATVSLILSLIFRMFIANKCLPLYFKECVQNIKTIKHTITINKLPYKNFLKRLVDVRSGINLLAVLVVVICNEILSSYFYFILKLLFIYINMGG